MGFFSWETSDTQESIPNKYQDVRDTFTVFMILPDGRVYKESDYEGYGVFGDCDFYEAVHDINRDNPKAKVSKFKLDRQIGVDLALSDKPCLLPKLVRTISYLAVGFNSFRDTNGIKRLWHRLPDSVDCHMQGYFYGGVEFIRNGGFQK